jgi:hypothetical protein
MKRLAHACCTRQRLPLFATGLGLMGWFTWRKKRKALDVRFGWPEGRA